MAEMKTCPICNKQFEDITFGAVKVYCSKACRKQKKNIDHRIHDVQDKAIKFDCETKNQIKLDLKIGKCMICGRERKEGEKDFHIDHDHVTGDYRGILCVQCNHALGNIYDSPFGAIELCKYLIAKKSRGIDYTDSFWLMGFEKQLNSVVSLLGVEPCQP